MDECKPLQRGIPVQPLGAGHGAGHGRGVPGRSLHSSTSQHNVSTFLWLQTSTFRFVVSTLCGPGCVFMSQKRLRMSWEVDASCGLKDKNWLRRDVDECKARVQGGFGGPGVRLHRGSGAGGHVRRHGGRGLHSSTSQLNLSRF